MSLYIPSDGETAQSQTQSHSPTPSPQMESSPVNSYFSPTTRSFSNFSTTSSQSLFSTASSMSKTTSTSTSGSGSRRRGYVRPQGATFAPSAKSRDSVMNLGSIAHLQYYFARTGLLDGRTGQFVKKKENGEYDLPKLASKSSLDTLSFAIDEEGELLYQAAKEEGSSIMLPPTVSTYRSGSQYVPPPPSQQVLKRELVESLENALHALEDSEKATKAEDSPTQGFFEIQGLHILDSTTLAIRAARQYYTHHPNPQRLNSIKSDAQIRKELYDVLEILKQVAGRNFAGGLKEEERLMILVWVSDIGMMIDTEAKLDEAEKSERSQWEWLVDSKWIGNEYGRNLNFLDFLIRAADYGTEESFRSLQDKFWQSLADGKKLIRMHNAAVKKSKKRFDYIEKCHEDTAKPYRRAENVRFWLKAAELRFELKLQLDVLATVTATDGSDQIHKFEAVVLQWADGVRKELSKDWNGEEERKLHARAKSLALASPLGSPSKHGRAPAASSPIGEEAESP